MNPTRTVALAVLAACLVHTSVAAQQASSAAQQAAPLARSVPQFDLSTSQDGYLLGPGDRLNVVVVGVEAFSGPQLVLPDGTISMPLVGSVAVSGRTPVELSSDLERRLAAFVRRPRVFVRVDALRPIRVNVGGEVLTPGPRQIQNLVTGIGTAGVNTLPTLTTAIVQAGGVTPRADVANIVVSRRLSNGGIQQKRIDLWKTINEGRIEEDIFLKDGDSILVPQCAEDCVVNSRTIARTTVAPSRIRVRVFGEVNRPTALELDARSTLADAIASVGGMTNLAAPDQVEVISLEADGTTRNRIINANQALSGDASQNLQLRDQDAVIVRRSFGGELFTGLNTFASPVATVANLFFIFRNFR
jgi:polysaccharide export outer membrane protein